MITESNYEQDIIQTDFDAMTMTSECNDGNDTQS